MKKPPPKPAAPTVKRHVGPLNGRQRRHLRGLGHHLNPVVLVGQNGVTPEVIAATRQALEDHELIKVKINDGPLGRHEAAESLAHETGAELAQLLGRTALLFKQRREKPKLSVDPPRAAKVKAKARRSDREP